MGAEEQTTELSLDADQILSAVESGQDPSQLPAQGSAKPGEGQPDGQSASEQAAEQFRKELKVDGRTVEVTDPDKYHQWAQQGYSYSQQMEALNQEREKWQQEKADLEQRLSKYNEVDSYAQENPDWWNHVESQWQNRELQKLSPEVQEAVKPFIGEIQEVKKFINDYQREKEEQQAKQQDEQLDKEITQLQEQFPEINFRQAGQDGQSLELAIIRHANQHGIPSFRAAFLDYYHEPLQRIYEQRGREAVETDLAKRRKAGILGQGQAPVQAQQQGYQPSRNVRGKSYDDLFREAQNELGIH